MSEAQAQAIHWLVWWVAVGTLVCVIGEVLRWRRLRLMAQQLDELQPTLDFANRLDAMSERLDSQSKRITVQVQRLDEQAIGLAEVLERTRLHRRLLDMQHERLDIHGKAIGVVTVFDDPRSNADEVIAAMKAALRGAAEQALDETDEQFAARLSRQVAQ